MPSHTEQQLSPYSPRQLFDLVADIEKYPDFLPWCRAARVLERKENEFLGELIISFAHITESYTSRVTLGEPTENGGSIDVVMVKGPFEHLTNQWKFMPTENGTIIDFTLDFKFRSRILEKMIGSLFTKAASKMAGAFKNRAQELYGDQKIS